MPGTKRGRVAATDGDWDRGFRGVERWIVAAAAAIAAEAEMAW